MWAITLFVSPSYNQPTCSTQTVLVMFLVPIKVSDLYKHEGLIAIWPLWLLFCLGVSTAYGVILVLRATEYAADEASFSRTSTMLLHHTDMHKVLWTPFKGIPPLPLTLGTFERSTRWTRAKWTAERKMNRVARQVHKAMRVAKVALVFLLPPLPDKQSKRDYRPRRRVWIGNAIAVLLYLCSSLVSTPFSHAKI